MNSSSHTVAGTAKAVPPLLVQSTLRAATSGIGATPVAAALIEETMRMMFVYKLKVIGTAVMLFALTGTGVAMMTLRPQAAKENAPPVIASDDKPMSSDKRVDLYGDPLPKGAAMRLGTIQRRAVNAQIAVSADGKSVFSARAGKYLRIWDAQTGKLREKRELPGDSHNSLAAFSPDGRLLAVHNDSAEELRIWDVVADKIIQTLPLKNRAVDGPRHVHVQSLAFAPDAKNLAALDVDGDKHRIRIWNTKIGKEVFHQKFERGSGITDRIVLATDGKRSFVLFASIYTGLLCWDAATGRQVWQHKDERPYDIVATPDGKILCSSQQLQALDLATGRTLELANPPSIDPCSQLHLVGEGRALLIANDKGVAVWDWRRGKQLRTLPDAGEGIAVLPDGKSIIANNGALQRWDLETGKPLWTDTFAHGHVGEVLALAFSADGKRLASASADGSVRLWDAATGRPLRVWRGHTARRPIPIDLWRGAGATALDISADGRWVFSASSDDRLKLWDAAADKEVRTIVAHKGETGYAGLLHYKTALDPKGDRAVVLFGPMYEGKPQKCVNKLVTWNPKTGELLARHSVELESSGFYSLSSDGGLARISNAVVDVASGKETVRLPALYGPRSAISRDGALVAGIARDRDGVRIWESATGKLVASFPKIKWTAQIVFHPANHLLATNDLDGIQLWNVRSGKRLARFQTPEPVRVGTPTRNISCLAFTADGRRMATGMPDGTVLLWDVPPPASRRQALTAKEVESLWTDLADADAAKAWRAVWRLADAPRDALAFLHDRVKPYPTAPVDVTRKLLADLDGDSFARREAAGKQLKKMGLRAESALRAALAAKPSLEQRRRIEELLAALQTAPPPPTREELQQLRALIVLERIATPDARRLLEKVAKGPPSATLTRQARAALMCRHD